MNQVQDYQKNKKRGEWERARLQQYADRNGLSLAIVQVWSRYPGRDLSFEEIEVLIDRSVDSQFHSLNKPV